MSDIKAAMVIWADPTLASGGQSKVDEVDACIWMCTFGWITSAKDVYHLYAIFPLTHEDASGLKAVKMVIPKAKTTKVFFIDLPEEAKNAIREIREKESSSPDME